jgi:hypothetical protein
MFFLFKKGSFYQECQPKSHGQKGRKSHRPKCGGRAINIFRQFRVIPHDCLDPRFSAGE